MSNEEAAKASKARAANVTSESASEDAVFTLDASKLCPAAEVKSSLMSMLFEASPQGNAPFRDKMTDFDKDLAEQNGEKVSGYFIRYNVATGEYEKKTRLTPVQKAWNSVLKTAKQTLDGVSISKFDWKSGSEG